MHNLLFICIAIQTVEVSLNYLYYQCHISGQREHGKRCVNTFLYVKSSKKEFYQRYREKMFSFHTIWFGLYRIYTFGVSYLFLTVVFTSGTWLWFSPLLFWDCACWRLHWMGFWEMAGPSAGRSFISSSLLIVSFCFWGAAKWLQQPPLGCDQDWERVTFLLTPLWVSLSVTSKLPAQGVSLLLKLPVLTILLLKTQAQVQSPYGNYLVIRNRPKAVLWGEAMTFDLCRPGFQGCLEVGGLCRVNTRYFSTPHNCGACKSNITSIPRRNRPQDV